MTTPHRTLQMALDALAEYTHDEDTGRCHGCGKKIGGAHHPPCPVDAAITALREALAAAPEPKPVARCILDNGDEMGSVEWLVRPRSIRLDHGSLLYAAPPAAPAPVVPEGDVVVSWNEDGQIVAVTRQDEEGRILSVIAESAAPAVPADAALNTLARLFHNGEEVESDDGAAMVVDLSLWHEASEALDSLIGDGDSETLASPAAPPAAPAPVVPLQGGMDNNELLAAWQKKLPGRVPEGQELNAFAVGIEVGFEHAQRLERMDWDRVHHVLAKHGKHPGRTDDHLADVIDKALSAAPAAPVPDGMVMVPREPTPEMLAVVRNGPMHETWTEGYCAMIAASPAAPAAPVVREPLTDEQIWSMWMSSEFRGNGGQADWFCEGIRAAEAHHGITGGKP